MTDMTITKSQAISLYKALGYNTADRWSVKRLEAKLKGLPENADASSLTGAVKKGYESVCKVLEKGGKVSVKDTSPGAEEKDKKAEADAKDAEERNAKKNSKKKTPASKAPSYGRFEAVVDIIKKRKKNALEVLVQESDKLFMEKTGKSSNASESKYAVNTVVKVLKLVDFIAVEDNVVIRKS